MKCLILELNLTLTNRDLNQCFYISGPNLVIPAGMGELLRRQTQNEVNLEVKVQFDLEGEDHWTSDPNFVVLAWMGDELWRGQARGWHTDTITHKRTNAHAHTHTHAEAMTIPSGQHWHWVKNIKSSQTRVTWWDISLTPWPDDICSLVKCYNTLFW